MKKKIAILSAIFALFLVIGLWFNLTTGQYFMDRFWRFKDGAYTSWGDSIRHADGMFELSLDEQEITASLSETEDGYRVDFSDGWAVELEALNPSIQVEIDGVIFTGDSEYILTDMNAANLRFGRVAEEVCEPFYDGNGNKIGESRYLMTETGESIGWQEIWYDNPEWSSPEMGIILLREGTRFTYDDLYENLFVNEEGEYLLNSQDMTMVRWSGTTWYSRNSVAAFLSRIAQNEPEMRGHVAAVFLYALIYLLGAATFLWPQETAFFGHRWKFQTEPELSEAGLFMEQLGAVLVMIMGIVILFAGV